MARKPQRPICPWSREAPNRAARESKRRADFMAGLQHRLSMAGNREGMSELVRQVQIIDAMRKKP